MGPAAANCAVTSSPISSDTTPTIEISKETFVYY